MDQCPEWWCEDHGPSRHGYNHSAAENFIPGNCPKGT